MCVCGGLRHPTQAVARLPGLQRVGERARNVIIKCFRDCTSLREIGLNFGEDGYGGPKAEEVKELRTRQHEELGVVDGRQAKPTYEKISL